MNFKNTYRLSEIGSAPWIAWLPGTISLLLYYVLYAWSSRGFELDDALIYLRYIRNFVDGHGLIYNVGVYFNGLTSPLFSYLLSVVALIVGHLELVSWALSALFFFLAALAMWIVFLRQIDLLELKIPRFLIWVGAWIFLAQPYFYATYGMETGLYTLLSALLIYFAMNGRFQAAGPLAALLFLTRSEGIFLVAALGLVQLLRYRALPKWNWRTYVLPLVLIGACWSFNYFYYGHPLAETGMAKVGQGRSGLWGSGVLFLQVGYLEGFLSAGVGWLPYALAVCTLFGVWALGFGYVNLVVMGYLVMYTGFYVGLNIPSYHWYYSPYFAFWPFYSVIGVGFIACKLTSWLRGEWRKTILGAAIVASLSPVWAYSINPVRWPAVVPEYKTVGQYLNQHTRSDAVVAAVEIGIVGYYSKRAIVDILGLVNPLNARFIGERDFDEWLKHYRVDYFVAHKPLWGHELSALSLALTSELSEVCGATKSPILGLYQVRHGASGMVDCDGQRWQPMGKLVDVQVGANAREQVRGHVDQMELLGNYLRLRGWAATGDGVATALGLGVQKGFWRPVSRPDVVKVLNDAAMAQAGFDMVLVFDTPEESRRAMDAATCITVQGASGQVLSLPISARRTCDRQP